MTNVHGYNYGTHIDGVEGRTLCKRYAQRDVNRVGPGEEHQASCKLCQRAWLKTLTPPATQTMPTGITKQEAAKRVKTAVVEAFIDTGNAVDAVEIAKALGTGWNPAKVRRVVSDNQGFLEGLRSDTEQRPSYEKAYGTMRGTHTVTVYQPTLETLRQLVLELRAGSARA